jgi:hypothetical protein
MSVENLDWKKIKADDYDSWRNKLDLATIQLLKSKGKIELSSYNSIGYYHRVRNPAHFEIMKNEWRRIRKVPGEWISKGNVPGIWTAMFDPCNTYSYGISPICIMRVYFKQGYYIFDPQDKNHNEFHMSWENRGETNEWNTKFNDRGASLAKRMKELGCPDSKQFYRDNNFGAVIGYHDYVSPVIVMEDAVENLEFTQSEL